jgi:hypothetical protein
VPTSVVRRRMITPPGACQYGWKQMETIVTANHWENHECALTPKEWRFWVKWHNIFSLGLDFLQPAQASLRSSQPSFPTLAMYTLVHAHLSGQVHTSVLKLISLFCILLLILPYSEWVFSSDFFRRPLSHHHLENWFRFEPILVPPGIQLNWLLINRPHPPLDAHLNPIHRIINCRPKAVKSKLNYLSLWFQAILPFALTFNFSILNPSLSCTVEPPALTQAKSFFSRLSSRRSLPDSFVYIY